MVMWLWKLMIFVGMTSGLMGEKISDFRWESRLLVVSGADEDFLAVAAKETKGIQDRDLRVFVLSGEWRQEFPVGKGLRAEFVERLSVLGGERKFWLIGKDGNTVLQWTAEEFTFDKVFSAIDGMPMRQREIREKEGR